ncbi:hypothetical protein [Streptomyces sp. NPDC088733]|uniref:hypothetical protein n=1 Tax=Streptomyces sp. NPDC088733 TaxID=3365880 RepID=UPI003815C696
MSFNQPPPQPGWGGQPGYGPPPQPPTQPQPQVPPGYGSAPQDGYGYPPQPAQPPQGGIPQQPGAWGQQPGAWGAPPPPPPSGGGKGKVAGIVIGVVLAIALIGGGLVFLLGGNGGGLGGGGGGGDYTLSMPATLLGGEYTKDASNGANSGLSNGESGNDAGIKSAKTVSGAYKNSSNSQLVVSGAYGDITDPGAALDAMLTGFKNSAASSAGQEPTEQHPAGFDGAVMKCGTFGSGGVTFPYCAWADDSTVAMAMNMNLDILGTTRTPSVAEWADSTVKIRDEVRVKK